MPHRRDRATWLLGRLVVGLALPSLSAAAERPDPAKADGSTLAPVLLAQPRARWSAALLQREPEWYASAEARAVADSVLRHQSPQGGWPKNTDLAAPRPPAADAGGAGDLRANTIDNGATTTPLRFLALVAQATGDARFRAAVDRVSTTCSPPSTPAAAGRSTSPGATATTPASPSTTTRWSTC